MLGFEMVIQLGFIADHALAQLRHRSGKRHHRDAAQQVVKNVEVDNQLGLGQRQLVHRRGQRMDERQNDQAPHQLKQQAAQRHPARRRVRRAVVEHRQQPRSQVGANHQAQRHRERDRSRRGQRRGQQHRRQAGVANDREYSANQGIQHDIPGQRGKNHLHAVGLGNGVDGLHNQLQGQQDQPKADPHSPQLPGAGLLAAEEENHPDKYQQRRQPRQVEGQYPRHQRRPNIGAQHHHQRRREAH